MAKYRKYSKEFNNNKATIVIPNVSTITRKKENGRWVIDISDNPLIEGLSEKNNKAYRAVIEEANSTDATIESIKKVFEKTLYGEDL